MNIKGPAILLFRGRGVISTLIRWQTRGPYSHAAFLLPDGRVLESWQGKGVRLRAPLTDWEGADAYYIPGMTDEQWEIAIDYALDQIGKKYDYWAIIRFISRHNMPKNDNWFCSELVFDSLSEAKVPLLHRIAGWAVSPGLLSFSPMIAPLIPVSETTDVSVDLEVIPETEEQKEQTGYEPHPVPDPIQP